MLDGIIKQALEALISQGGGWLIAALLLVAVIVLSRKLEKAQNLCDTKHIEAEKEIRDQFEKRLKEHRELLDALNRSTGALQTMQISVDARTEAINNLVAGFAALVRDQEASRVRFMEKADGLAGALTDIRGRLEDLQRRVPS